MQKYALLLLFLASSAFAGLSKSQKAYLEFEKLNDHFKNNKIDSEIAKRYQVGAEKPVSIPYVDVPQEELHVVDFGLGNQAFRSHFFVEHSGRNFFRFFIHPHSKQLYAKLVRRYGVAGHYLGIPTSSARTLLAWDPEHPKLPALFLKLSLARQQFGLGRVIADWEVRRSVAITALFNQIPQEEKNYYGVDLIPEYLGAYVDRNLEAGFFIDSKQHFSLQHGLIARDASFLDHDNQDFQTYPLFALFSVGPNGEAPLIVKWANESGLSFTDFVEEALLKPFVRATAYLVFHQGLIPDAHGQNIVVRVNRKTKVVEKVLYRDLGSIKVEPRIRWAHRLSIQGIITHNTAYDFKFPWAGSLVSDPFTAWFFPYLFTAHMGQNKSLEPFVPNYDSKLIHTRMLKHLVTEVKNHLPGGLPEHLEESTLSLTKYLESALKQNPYSFRILPNRFKNKNHASGTALGQVVRGQYMLLQRKQIRNFDDVEQAIEKDGAASTSEGIVFFHNSNLYLAFWPVLSTEVPLNYDAHAPFENVFIGKEALGPFVPKGTKKGIPMGPNANRPIAAIRYGVPEEVHYQLIEKQEDARFLANNRTDELNHSLLVRVTADLTGLSQDKQEKLLSKMGRQTAQPVALLSAPEVCKKKLDK